MYIVTINRLGATAERAATLLSAAIPETEWEVQCRLRGKPPWVVLATGDRERALRVLGALREGGHSAVACDSRAVRSSTDLASLRTFHFRRDGVAGHSPAGDDLELPYADVLAIVRARANGEVAYVFRVSGAPPWILRERGTSYAGLGATAPAEPHAAYLETLRRLRIASGGPPCDDRLVHADLAPVLAYLTRGQAAAAFEATGAPRERLSSAPGGLRARSVHPSAPPPGHLPPGAALGAPRLPAFEGLDATPAPPWSRPSDSVLPPGNPWRRSELPGSFAPLPLENQTLIPASTPPEDVTRQAVDVLAHLVALGLARQQL
ncbi:MAG: hypothetical protein IT376_04130 [Polyangiaceae bacterium]|nr:hypothetical protein [Polyangiaceae bacterium]